MKCFFAKVFYFEKFSPVLKALFQLVFCLFVAFKGKIRLGKKKKAGLGGSRESLAASDFELSDREKFSAVSWL